MKDKWKWELELAPEPNLAEDLQNIIFEYYDMVYTDPSDGKRVVGANKHLYDEVVRAIRRRIQFVHISDTSVIFDKEWAKQQGVAPTVRYQQCFDTIAQKQLEADSKLLDNELELLKDVDDVD